MIILVQDTKLFVSSMLVEVELQSYNEASRDKIRIEAIKHEVKAFKDNHT